MGNELQRKKFIRYIENLPAFRFDKLLPIDAVKVDDGHICKSSSALENDNIINQNLNGKGLQITLNPNMLADINNDKWPWNSIYHAVHNAVSQDTRSPTSSPTSSQRNNEDSANGDDGDDTITSKDAIYQMTHC